MSRLILVLFNIILLFTLVVSKNINTTVFNNVVTNNSTTTSVDNTTVTNLLNTSTTTVNSTSHRNCFKSTVKKDNNNISASDVPCKELNLTELNIIKTFEIQQQILRKLRLPDPPNVTLAKSMIPRPLQGGELQYLFDSFNKQYKTDDDDYYGKIERVIIIAENVEHPICAIKHHDPAGCFSFKLTNDVLNRDVHLAELWVYKLRDKRDNYNQTYIIYEMSSMTDNFIRKDTVISIRETNIKNGWLKFDMTVALKRWIMTTRTKSIHNLKISCKTCAMDVDDIPVSNDPGEKPFIIINFNKQDISKRNRRGVDCQPNSTYCCKESLYLNFTEIGWSNWIIAPEGYQANYCRGSCMADIATSSTSYNVALQQLLARNIVSSSATFEHLRNSLSCCTPNKLSSISILISNTDGEIKQNVISNMKVESCGCR